MKKNKKSPFLTVTQFLKRQDEKKIAKSKFREEKRQLKIEQAKSKKKNNQDHELEVSVVE